MGRWGPIFSVTGCAFYLLICSIFFCYGVSSQKTRSANRNSNTKSRQGSTTANAAARSLDQYAEISDCTAKRIKFIKYAILEAKSLLEAARAPDYGHMPAQEYLGAQLRQAWEPTYESKLNEVFKTAADFISSKIEGLPTPEIYCERSQHPLCPDPRRISYDDPIVVQHSGVDDNDMAGVSFTICKAFFRKRSLKNTLGQARFCLRSNDTWHHQKALDLDFHENRGLWFAHAIFHTRFVTKGMVEGFHQGSFKKRRKMIYEWPHHDSVETEYNSNHWTLVVNPWTAKKLALNYPTDADGAAALGSPTNYALYALAQYVMEQLGDYPYGPRHYSEPYRDFYRPGDAGEPMCPGWRDRPDPQY
ncbi:hypothetical protein TWF696_006646 [Orbilia brochopaga]|uniref:Uncharacterized protein n=1 Tax=Orbilia brochopaga TaxID=3140254 RepID=A0AAV9UVQ5_9PEZI